MIEYLALEFLAGTFSTSATYKTYFFWAFMISNFLTLLTFLVVYLFMKKIKHRRQQAAKKREEEMLLEATSSPFNLQTSSNRMSEYRGSIPLQGFFSN